MSVLKVKLGTIAISRSSHDTGRNEKEMRVDANCGWTVKGASDVAHAPGVRRHGPRAAASTGGSRGGSG